MDFLTQNWPILAVVCVLAALYLLKQGSQVGAGQARELLAGGALVIDVRSPGEFGSGHLKGAANVPLDRLGDAIGKAAPDKSKPLLVHCLSGTRSALACRTLRAMGYDSVHNLGSLGRARKLTGR